jgi:hypothetical protein
MALTGLIAKIIRSVVDIDMGRKCFMIDGQEREGRILYELGSSTAMEVFTIADPQIIIQSDHTYTEQELQFCHEDDKDTRSSLTTALQSFDDALLSYEAVLDPVGYKIADKTHPHYGDYRIQGCPKDAFHIACKAHVTRLRNSLRTPGVNMTEKAVTNQRIANMCAAKKGYLELQVAALKP